MCASDNQDNLVPRGYRGILFPAKWRDRAERIAVATLNTELIHPRGRRQKKQNGAESVEVWDDLSPS
jgi:hypothetical protein